MSDKEEDVSPYLRRPCRSHAEVLRMRATVPGNAASARTGPDTHRTIRIPRARPMRTMMPEQIADLQALDAGELRSRWQEVFGSPAWKGASRDLLLRGLAYRTQEIAEGGLSKSALRSLAKLTQSDGSVTPPPQSSTPRLKPGTRLVREWRGETHQVTVMDAGFEYRGSRYASLSEIARLITGTRWSGPLFFGLRNPSPVRSADET